jgi:Flp pilus assembly protein TadB
MTPSILALPMGFFLPGLLVMLRLCMGTCRQRRKSKVEEFRKLFLDWVAQACRSKGMPEEAVAIAGGEVGHHAAEYSGSWWERHASFLVARAQLSWGWL